MTLRTLLFSLLLLTASAAFGACDNTSASLGNNWTLTDCAWNSSGGTPATATTVSFTVSAAHHVLTAMVNQSSAAGQTLTVTSTNNTWTCPSTSNYVAAGLNLALCYVVDSVSGADTVSCNSNVSEAFLGCVVGEFSNSGGVSAGFDTSNMTQSSTGSTNFTMTQNLTLAQSGELVVAAATVSNGPYTNVTGWTSLSISAAGVTTSAPAVSANSSASSGSFDAQIIDQANSDSYIIGGIAFKPPAASGATHGITGKATVSGKAKLQ